MISVPEPVLKGIFRETATGKDYWTYFLKHHEAIGESSEDDCYITLPVTLTGGAENCGETGLFPKADFTKQFAFVAFIRPGPGKKFGE